MPTVGNDMLIDQVDDHDRPIGQIPRSTVFSVKAGFRVSHVFVFNESKQLLLQRIAQNRERHAGQWGSSVAAYLFSGEDYVSAAERRIKEELGITDLDLRLIGKTAMRDDGCTKFISLFTTISKGPFQFDRNHIEELQFVSLPQIGEMLRTRERKFTPTFAHVLDLYVRSAHLH
jgi:isopentenyl-diphosphate delta-isomerase